jgi:hypothetical protein
MHASCQRLSNFKLRYETRVGKLQKKQIASHIDILSRQRKTVLSANLLEGGSISPRLDEDAAAATGVARAC